MYSSRKCTGRTLTVVPIYDAGVLSGGGGGGGCYPEGGLSRGVGGLGQRGGGGPVQGGGSCPGWVLSRGGGGG